MAKTRAQLDDEIEDYLRIHGGTLAPGMKVTCDYREGHVGTVLAIDDPKAWAGTHMSPGGKPTRSQVEIHLAKHPTVGRTTVPVSYRFGVMWDSIRSLHRVVR